MITWHLTNEVIDRPNYRGVADPKIVSLVGRLGRTGWHVEYDDRLPRDHVYAGVVEFDEWGTVRWADGMNAVRPIVYCHPDSIGTIGRSIENLRTSLQEDLARRVRESYARLFGEDFDQ